MGKLLRLAGEVARRAGGVSRPRCHPAWRTKGSLRPTWRTEQPLWPPHGIQKSRYAPVGVRPPPPLRGSSPCEAGQFYYLRPYIIMCAPLRVSGFAKILVFFGKKLVESLPESKKGRTFAPAIGKTTGSYIRQDSTRKRDTCAAGLAPAAPSPGEDSTIPPLREEKKKKRLG